MRLHQGTATVAMFLALASCTTGTPAGPAPAAQVEDPACHAKLLAAGRARAGDNLPFTMLVKNVGRRCWTGFAFSGVAMGASQLVNPPAHGNTLVHALRGGLVIGYLPAAGYAGSDSFVIEVPTGYGLNSNLDFHVNVVP